MKLYIRSDVKGKIAETGEPCVMRANGYWKGYGGKRRTSYTRTDKEVEYTDDDIPVIRQYSMDRNHRFWLETEDVIQPWEYKNYGVNLE